MPVRDDLAVVQLNRVGGRLAGWLLRGSWRRAGVAWRGGLVVGRWSGTGGQVLLGLPGGCGSAGMARGMWVAAQTIHVCGI